MRIRDFRDLEVWEKSADLAVAVQKITRTFPPEERFEMTAQLRRAPVSVSSNIAEGSARTTTKDLLNFISIARGSLRETESLLLISHRLGLLTDACLQSLLDLIHRIGMMLSALTRSLRKRLSR